MRVTHAHKLQVAPLEVPQIREVLLNTSGELCVRHMFRSSPATRSP